MTLHSILNLVEVLEVDPAELVHGLRGSGSHVQLWDEPEAIEDGTDMFLFRKE